MDANKKQSQIQTNSKPIVNDYFNSFTEQENSQVQNNDEDDDDDKDKEKKKVKNISQHTSSFIYLFRNARAYILENVTAFVSQMEVSPEGQALLLLSLISVTKSIKVSGWSTIGKYYDYKVDKLLGQGKKGRAPNPPSVSLAINRRMLLTNCGILAYAYRKEISCGLKDLLDTPVEINECDESTPVAYGGKRKVKGGAWVEDDYSDLIKILEDDKKNLEYYNFKDIVDIKKLNSIK
jgi:hypothetical protein